LRHSELSVKSLSITFIERKGAIAEQTKQLITDMNWTLEATDSLLIASGLNASTWQDGNGAIASSSLDLREIILIKLRQYREEYGRSHLGD